MSYDLRGNCKETKKLSSENPDVSFLKKDSIITTENDKPRH